MVPLATHWESRWVAPHVMLARGWERQLDRYRNPLFYEEPAALTPQRYREWLTANAVSYVALPDAKVDYSAEREAALLRGAGRRPYLRAAVELGSLAAVRRRRRRAARLAARGDERGEHATR